MSFIFFTSYSSKNRTKAFERFVKTLQNHVFQRVVPALAREEDVTFFAPSTLELGDAWGPRLVDALRTSRVLVCFCSPHFFASTYCGRELKVFLDRRHAWLTTPGNEARRARVIFPIHWVKPQGSIPKVLESFQDDHGLLPRKYRENGLLALTELKKERDVVTEVAIRIADAIVSALNDTSLPDLPTAPAIDKIMSAFDAPASTSPYQLALLCLNPSGCEWRPYPSGPMVADIVAPISATSQRFWIPISPAGDVISDIDACGYQRSAVIVLGAPEAVTAVEWQPLWQALEATQPAHCAIVLAWPSTTTPAEQTACEAALRGRMPTFMTAARPHNLFKVVSPATLAAALAETAEALCLRLVQSDAPTQKVDDGGLRSEARQVTGVEIASRPHVSGPGGGV